ncbi:hypothetical protein [Sphingobacterium siyangense]|uniref:hypothetical protein n=1 Tax=Sphingobacterium siyangense TaxID=459529 RepID=UPI0019669FF2|nr:hypothetical protein [Sphingobacterium siyangense]QRY57122.1 hypothetical protein JVX97_24525 [Sphingobacterium siyangense]
MKSINILTLLSALFICLNTLSGQEAGIKTKNLGDFSSSDNQAREFKLFDLSYNTHHWQNGASVIVEVFQDFYAPAYAKYVINFGYGKGANYGTGQLYQVENFGSHEFAVAFGTGSNLATQYSGYPNAKIPVMLKIKAYISCRVKVTYTYNEVASVANYAEIAFGNTSGTVIPDFTAQTMTNTPMWTTGSLRVEGMDNHYISQGNLGIGTKNPQDKLSVNGKIRAHEIRVTTATADWPDYVFKADYDLKPLSEIEQYIKNKGHLPGVPTASEAESNGIELGELNKVLLKKIEELTLHAIETKKHIEQQDKEISALKELINNNHPSKSAN